MPPAPIADDNETVRRALRPMSIGVSRGWSICGEAAKWSGRVQLAAQLEPDVVLLDFQMPVMNGLEAGREIAKNHPPIPIAMYTFHQDTMFEKEARAFGVRKVICKKRCALCAATQP